VLPPGAAEPVTRRYAVKVEVENLPDGARLVGRVPAPQPYKVDLQLIAGLVGLTAFAGWAAWHFHTEGRATSMGIAIALAIGLGVLAVVMGWTARRDRMASRRERGAPVLVAPRLRLRAPPGVVELTVDPIRGEDWETLMEALGYRLEGDVLLLDARVDVIAPGGPTEIVCAADGYEPPQAVRRGADIGFAVVANGAPAEWTLAYDVVWDE
jgi:hypothetical protein